MSDRESIVAWLRSMSTVVVAGRDWREFFRITALCIESRADEDARKLHKCEWCGQLQAPRAPEPPEYPVKLTLMQRTVLEWESSQAQHAPSRGRWYRRCSFCGNGREHAPDCLWSAVMGAAVGHDWLANWEYLEMRINAEWHRRMREG